MLGGARKPLGSLRPGQTITFRILEHLRQLVVKVPAGCLKHDFANSIELIDLVAVQHWDLACRKPLRPSRYRISSPARLPVPPSRHKSMTYAILPLAFSRRACEPSRR